MRPIVWAIVLVTIYLTLNTFLITKMGNEIDELYDQMEYVEQQLAEINP